MPPQGIVIVPFLRVNSRWISSAAPRGAYEAIVSDAPANFEPEALQGFDAVVLLSPSRDFFMPSHKQRKEFSKEDWAWLQARHNRLVDNLLEYVEQGGGLVGIHAATDSCQKHSGYGAAMGAYFDGHPWMASSTVTINVEEPDHALLQPVFGGKSDFRIKDEIYQFKDEPYSREKLRILLSLDVERSDPPTIRKCLCAERMAIMRLLGCRVLARGASFTPAWGTTMRSIPIR